MTMCNHFRLIIIVVIMAEGGPSYSASASSNSKNDVNEEYLRNLIDMGIHQDDARQVLSFS